MKRTEIYPDDVGIAPRSHVFTLDKANKTLPLVRRIVQDIVTLYREMAAAQERLAPDTLDLFEREQLELAAVKQELELEGLIDELTAIGCDLKDANIGLVDFIGRHDGRYFYLCWHLGEEKIEYWHELHAGVGGRCPVSTLRE